MIVNSCVMIQCGDCGCVAVVRMCLVVMVVDGAGTVADGRHSLHTRTHTHTHAHTHSRQPRAHVHTHHICMSFTRTHVSSVCVYTRARTVYTRTPLCTARTLCAHAHHTREHVCACMRDVHSHSACWYACAHAQMSDAHTAHDAAATHAHAPAAAHARAPPRKGCRHALQRVCEVTTNAM